MISKVKELTAKLAQQGGAKDADEKSDPNAPSWIGQVAVLTGVLAALTGFVTVRVTSLTNQAIYESNQAILSQTQASDAWAEYQADSIKAHIIEMQLLPSSSVSPADRQALTKMKDDFRSRQPENKQTALSMVKEREAHLASGMNHLRQKDNLGYAGMIAQIGIALASVAALTRKRVVFYLGAAAGVAAVTITACVLVSGYLAAG